jgi:hypothetical protein
MSVVTPDQQYPSHSHDYRPCSVRELRHFIQEHTTPTVGDKYRKHNKAKLVFHLKKLDAAAAGTLDYRACDVGELYDFIKSRTALTAAAIRKLNKAEMVTHLKTLDTQRAFWRFMDLATELRLKIYQQVLLIDGRESGKTHSALLRLSRLIHRESSLCCIATIPFTWILVNHPPSSLYRNLGRAAGTHGNACQTWLPPLELTCCSV